MAANKELQKVSLAFKLENGIDDEGNTLYKTKSFANVKGSASLPTIIRCFNNKCINCC